MIFLSGTLVCDGNDANWTLNAGSGERVYVARVQYNAAFGNIPMVTASLAGIDVSHGASKVYVGAVNVDSTGFDLELKTWADTRVWAVVVNWLAIGL